MKLLFSILLAVSCIVSNPTGLQAETFKAGVSAVDESLLPGQIFQPPEQRIIGFYAIPPWFAGVYKRFSITAKLPLIGGITRKCTHTVHHGHQTDLRGVIWHAQIEPFLHVVEEEKEITYYIVNRELPLSVSQNQVVIEYTTVNTTVGKKDGRIKRTQQSCETHTFAPGPNNTINAVIWPSTIYNDKGKFICKGVESRYTDLMLQSYQDTDSDDLFDYKSSFVRFLSRQH